jgi:type III secretion system FlhB-like substrate exporter
MLTLWFATGIICAQQTYGGAWLPIIYVKNEKKRPQIVEAVETAVEVAVSVKTAEQPAMTARERSEIARNIVREYEGAGLRLREIEALVSAIEKRAIEEARKRRNNQIIAILLMAG